MNESLNKRSRVAWLTLGCWVLLWVLIVAQHQGPLTFVVLAIASVLLLYQVAKGAYAILRGKRE